MSAEHGGESALRCAAEEQVIPHRVQDEIGSYACRRAPAPAPVTGRPPQRFPVALAIETYSGVQTAPNAQNWGCHGRLARNRYRSLSGLTVTGPVVALVVTAAAVMGSHFRKHLMFVAGR